MYTFMLQDWVTIRSAPALTVISQSAEAWLDISGFQDVIGWAEVKGSSLGGGTGIVLVFQSAPTKDETMMAVLTSTAYDDGKITISTAPGVFVAPALVNTSHNYPQGAPPIARWLRWTLAASGTLASNWDATFRIFISANAGGGRGKSLGGMAVAPSGRAGVPSSPGASGSIRTSVGGGSPSVPLHMSRIVPPASGARGAVRVPGASVPLHLGRPYGRR